MAIINTTQAPAAKPLAVNLELTTTYQTFVEANAYTVPLVGFNAGTRTARGVAEFSSPLLVTNISSSPATFSVQIVRGFSNPAVTFLIANEMVVEPNDVVIFPLNGQFLLREPTGFAGDRLQLKASANARLVATISYTEGQAEEDDVS